MRDTLIAASSCQYPPDFFRYRESYKSLGAIAELFSRPENRSLYRVLMLAGDTIYTDATAGLMDATDPHERFTQQYHKLRNSWAWRKIDSHENLFSIDDHELIDDWVQLDSTHPDKLLREERENIRKNGKDAFIKEMQLDKWSNGKTHHKYMVNGTPVFVMDSRTERSARNALNFNRASMIGDEQWTSLRNWMDQLADDDSNKSDSEIAPKIILSGSMLLPRRSFSAQCSGNDTPHVSCLRSDGWDGYPNTMHQVLSHIVKKKLRRVIFVSGDAHIPCICNVSVRSQDYSAINLLSVHGSGLNAPLPFANAVPEDFKSEEGFTLRAASNADDSAMSRAAEKAVDKSAVKSADKEAPLHINVKTQFPDVGDGYCVIRISNENGGKTCQISFAGRRNDYKPKLSVEF